VITVADPDFQPIYDQYKQRMAKQKKIESQKLIQNLPPVNLQEKSGNLKDQEQEHLDKLKYIRYKKMRAPEAIKIVDVALL
jgi:hypothetical protein